MEKKAKKEDPDITNLLLLAEVCWQEAEKIQRSQAPPFQWFFKKKRSTGSANRIRQFSGQVSEDNYEERATTAASASVEEAVAESSNNRSRKRKWADDDEQKHIQEHESEVLYHEGQQEGCSNKSSNNKKKMAIKKKMKVEKPSSVPRWVDRLAHTHLGNPEPAIWVCDKVLTKSDTDGHLKRFFIPRACSIDNLLPALTLQEQRMLGDGIAVRGLDETGRVWSLELKYWPSINMYVLQKEWTRMAEENGFEAENDTVQVWLCRCRHDESLCFVIGRKAAEVAAKALEIKSPSSSSSS